VASNFWLAAIGETVSNNMLIMISPFFIISYSGRRRMVTLRAA
jgi:hypothetical protein